MKLVLIKNENDSKKYGVLSFSKYAHFGDFLTVFSKDNRIDILYLNEHSFAVYINLKFTANILLKDFKEFLKVCSKDGFNLFGFEDKDFLSYNNIFTCTSEKNKALKEVLLYGK